MKRNLYVMVICSILLGLSTMCSKAYANTNVYEQDSPYYENTSIEKSMDAYIDKAIHSNFSKNSIDKIKSISNVQKKIIDKDTVQYTFAEKESSISKNKDQQYKIVTVVDKKLASADLNQGNTEYNGSVKLRAEMFYKRVTIDKNYAYKIQYGTGKVVSNDEKYGKNLIIKLLSSGNYKTTSGSRGSKKQGWYTSSKAKPAIGKTYKNSHTFEDKYYCCDEGTAILALDVTYQYSHNGTKWYTMTSQVRYGEYGYLQ